MKRYGMTIDIDRCTGCYACAVACMDQNDLDTADGAAAWRTIFTVESGVYPEASLRYVSLACMHCEDAPCVVACPTTALQRSGEPPVVRVGSHGFRDGPFASGSAVEWLPNSGVLVLPSTIRPAARWRSASAVLAGETWSARTLGDDIEPGEEVVVDSIEGATAIVRRAHVVGS